MREHIRVALFTNRIDHFVNGQTADQAPLTIDHRRTDQVVALERLRRVVHFVQRIELEHFFAHHVTDQHIRLIDQQAVQTQTPEELIVVIDHKNLVGLLGQAIHLSQLRQHHFQRHIGTRGEHVVVHRRTDHVVGVAHGGAQLRTLFERQALGDFFHDLARQVVGQIGNLVGIEVFRRRHHLLAAHVGDQRFTHRVGDFEQNFTVARRIDQTPNMQTIVQRQGFEHVGDIRRMQTIEHPAHFRIGVCVDGHQLIHIRGHATHVRLAPIEQGVHHFQRLSSLLGLEVLFGFAL